MPDNQELDTLRAALAEEKARNEALTGELNQLRERFAAVVRAERERSMAEFAIDTETKEAMLGMTDEHFAVALKLAKSAKTSLPSHLFHDTVNNGAPPGSKDERAGPGPLTAAVKAKFSA